MAGRCLWVNWQGFGWDGFVMIISRCTSVKRVHDIPVLQILVSGVQHLQLAMQSCRAVHIKVIAHHWLAVAVGDVARISANLEVRNVTLH